MYLWDRTLGSDIDRLLASVAAGLMLDGGDIDQGEVARNAALIVYDEPRIPFTGLFSGGGKSA